MTRERKILAGEIQKAVKKIQDYLTFVSNTDLAIKNTDWTIGTAAAHLVISQQVSRKILAGEETPYKNAKQDTIAATNAKLLKRFKERNTFALSQKLQKETDAYLNALEKKKDTATVQTHFGTLSIPECYAYDLCHLLLHGSSIARTLRKPLPVEEKHIAMVLPYLKKAMTAVYDKKEAKDFRGTFAIHIKNVADFAIICEGEHVRIEDTLPKYVDCHFATDPISFFLFATGVMGKGELIWDNKVRVWGLKPWKIIKLTSLFKSP